MERQPLTIYQKLTRTFGFPGSTRKPPAFEFDKEELLKTDSRTDYDKARLQAQQSQYIADKWSKLDLSLYNQSVYYEPNRLSAYYDFESMEFTPEVSAALDIYSEESTTKSEKGQILTIHSDSKRIKHILDDLFYNVLDVNTNLQMWTRGMCKYGDNFVYLKIDPNKGILGCQQLPNIEIERLEGARQSTPNQSDRVGSRFPSRELRFTWKNKDIEFQAWEIAHFRILGDDRKLPYGTCLKSDSYIRTIEGYKQIKDIQINDVVYSFDLKNQNKILSKVLDTVKSGEKLCYKISTKHNYIDVSEEHNILYYDKINQDFQCKNTLDFKIGDLLIIDKKNNINFHIVIDKTKPENCRNGYWNQIDSIPYEVTNEFAELFGFLIGDGWISNNAVYFAMGIHKTINEKYINYLEKFSNKSVKFHGGKNGKSQGICNSKMLKTILQRLEFEGKSYSKRIPKWVFSSSYDIRKSFLNGLIDSDGSFNVDKWNCKRYSIELSNEELIKDIKILVQSLGWKSGKISNRIRKNGCIGDRKFKTQRRSYYFNFYESINSQKLKYDVTNRLTDDFIVEPIISIENIGKHETYDIYVENENHNFYANGVVVHNSMLDKIRRIWKQLLLAEDAMLIYRTSRAPERRVFKIFVGNMDDKDIEAYVQKIANKFKRDQVVDQKNGQVDMRYNQMPVWKNTPIPLLDGRTITIEELSKEYEQGKENWVYSIQDKTLSVVPGKVVWCGKNYTANKLTKIYLDDNTWMMVAPEHPMILRDGTHKPAKELVPGESLMPFYTKKSSVEDGMKIIDYDIVYSPSTGKYEFVHRIVGNSALSEQRENTRKNTNFFINNNLTIHHKDYNKNNNSPNNLEWMGNVDHIEHHKSIGRERIIKYNTSNKKREQNKRLAKEQSWHKRFEAYNHSELHKEHDKIRKNAQLLDWSNPIKKQYRSEKMRVAFDDIVFEGINKNILSNKISNRKTMLEYLSTDMIDHIISINNNKRLLNLKKIERTVLEREIINKGFKNITEYIRAIKLNHKVLKIEEYFGNEDVYCMTVAGIHGEDDRHNFAMKSFNSDGSVSLSGSFSRNSVDQDYFIPVRDPAQPSPIETLPGAQNLGEIADIEYIQKKMLAALRIPKAFLGFEDVIGNGKGLALLDIRFARTINRIQQSIIQELNKIALIHLFLLGLEDELNNFTLMMTNPSGQSDLLKIESWKEKITMYKDATSDQSQIGILPVSHTWAKKNILGMSDNEVILDLQQQRLERAIGFELTNTAQIIKRSGVFDEVDKKYGIPEEERKKLEASVSSPQQPGGAPGGGGGGSSLPEMGGATGGGLGAPPAATGNEPGASMGTPPTGGEAPLSESKNTTKKEKILSMLGEDTSLEDLFDGKKAQDNIYLIEKSIKNILNE